MSDARASGSTRGKLTTLEGKADGADWRKLAMELGRLAMENGSLTTEVWLARKGWRGRLAARCGEEALARQG